jgi:hypothetical protein
MWTGVNAQFFMPVSRSVMSSQKQTPKKQTRETPTHDQNP